MKELQEIEYAIRKTIPVYDSILRDKGFFLKSSNITL
jgi:hypothetical protein